MICYSECIRISLSLVTQAPLFLLQKGKQGIVFKRVAFYDGNLELFHDKHLFYALPALFIVLTLGILPPLILISYPLCYKLFALLRINETKFTKLLCTCLPLEKFKPFFDSFQSSFKDEYRLFSGLYFLYRLTTLVSFAFIEIKYHYINVQIQFSVIFAVHGSVYISAIPILKIGNSAASAASPPAALLPKNSKSQNFETLSF